MTNPLEDAAEELAAAIQRLDESVRHANDVRSELDDLVRRSQKNRLLIRAVGAALAIEVALLGAMTFFGVQTRINANRIDNIVKIQHDSALCPLYQIFIQSDTPQNRARAEAQGQDMALRDRQFVIIRESYAALKCETKK
jgi:hypothetical protein